MRVPQLDLQAQYRALAPEMDRAVAGLFASQRFILGQAVADFETAMAEDLGGGCVGGGFGIAFGGQEGLKPSGEVGIGGVKPLRHGSPP